MRELHEHDKALIIDSIPEANLVLFCPSLQGHGGSLLDRSQYATHGTITGASWVGTPRGLKGLSFDGLTNYVSIGDKASLTFTAGGIDVPFTIMCWVYSDFAGTYGWINKATGATAGEFSVISVAGGNLYFRVVDDTVGALIGQLTNAVLAANTWLHVACTYDGTGVAGGCIIYVNGGVRVTTAQTTGVYVKLRDTAIDAELGRRGAGSYFKGKLAMIKAYDRALALAEITRHYTRERHLFGV